MNSSISSPPRVQNKKFYIKKPKNQKTLKINSPLPMNIINIDSPKSNIQYKKKQTLKYKYKTIDPNRYIRSQLGNYGRTAEFKKQNYNLQQFNDDQYNFSDTKIKYGNNNIEKKIKSQQNVEDKKILRYSIQPEKNISNNQDFQDKFFIETQELQFQNQSINTKKSTLKAAQRIKKMINKKYKNIVFPSLKIQSQKNRKNIHTSDLMNFQDRQKLDGWQLNNSMLENEKKLDIIQYTTKSIGKASTKNSKNRKKN